MTYPVTRGFLDYGDTADGSVILSAALTSASDIGGGAIVGAGAANVTYSANGILLNATAGLQLKDVISAANKTRMLGGFTLTCWIESGFFSENYVGGASQNEWIFSFRGINYTWGAYKAIGGQQLKCNHASTTNTYDTTATGKDTFCRFDMSYAGGGQTIFYLDKMPIGIVTQSLKDADPFSLFFGLGNTTTGRGLHAHRIKNLIIRNQPVVLDVRRKFNGIHMLGHSWAVGADYPNANAAITGDVGAGAYLDGRALPKIHRMLAEHGIGIPEGKIRNTGVSGVKVAGANGLVAQTTTATANGKKLKVVMLQFGTNEVISGTGTLASEYATLQTDYQTGIDALVTAGADIILVGNTVSTALSTLYGTGSANWLAYKQRCDDMNVIHAAIVAANSQCYLVDLFTAFGGHNLSATYIINGDYHPTDLGYQLVGQTFANKLIELI